MKIANHLLLLGISLLILPPLRAQLIVDGTTNTLSNVTNSFPGDVTVGASGSFSLLVISNNALLADALNGLIGLNATAKSNEVRLVSPSARWQVGGSLLVGSNGAFGRLLVSNGAKVEDNNGTLAFRAASSNNLALVTGTGSLWTNRSDLRIGNLGAGNQLIVSNGGWVANKFGYIGGSSSASNNAALVTGGGSTWSNQFDLYVGFIGGRSNRLVIEAGGLVACDNGSVGESGCSNNEALVTGPGSVWNNGTRMVVGLNGSVANRLTVSNGAAVWCGAPPNSGSGGTGGTGNRVVITGAGSVWTNVGDWNAAGTANRVDVSNGGWLANVNGFIVGSNTVALTGSGSGWNNSGDLQIGYFSDGSTLIASNGATVLSSNAFIGAFTSLGNNNFALLTGAGTLWSNQNDFTVGDFGVGNRLVVSNGASINVAGSGFVGYNSGGNSNTVTVTGPGSLWSIGEDLLVGRSGTSGNRVMVSNGASVQSINQGIIGLNGNSNTLTVTGSGSVWSNAGVIYAGFFGTGNRLEVSDGGAVRGLLGVVGENSSSTDSVAVVTGAGSLWSNATTLNVGEAGRRSLLVISNGGMVAAGDAVAVGTTPTSTDSRLVVDGGTLRATNTSGTAMLDVRRGTNALNSGTIETDLLVLTNESQGKFEFNGGTLITRGLMRSSTNSFAVNGLGAIPTAWDMRAGVSNYYFPRDVIIGSNSSFNQLLITNGAALTNAGDGPIGYQPGGNSNSVVLSGAGSVWNVANSLYAGYRGSANQLIITNGARVVAVNGETGIGGNDGADNMVLVAGAGSVLSNAHNLFVGFGGSRNRLVVSNGGTVFGGTVFGGVYIGFIPQISTNNRVIVDGGTFWATNVGSSRVDLQACKLEYSIVSPK